MLKAQVVVGNVYAMLVSGRICPVRVDSSDPPVVRKTTTHVRWFGTNLSTGRGVHIHSAQKLRYELVMSKDVHKWVRVIEKRGDL